MKRVVCLALSFLFVLLICPVCRGAELKVENTEYAFIYNPVFDEVLYESKADKVIYPASTVKMMTGIIAIEYYAGRYDTEITFNAEMLSLTGGTKISYKEGEVLTVEELLYGLLVGNGNDAAYALALSVCPTVDEFVTLMNEKAKSLGAEHTVYANPTGVDDNKAQTTVRDVAKIAAYASSMKEFIKYSSCERYDMEPT
ncbi:MAG: D-alanyl-D-alanine carboxypeptidase, partial [Clostridia bacterium]|nr:D-alanyl-D-alanine carboxypeptidase [Clostridia bacterium]